MSESKKYPEVLEGADWPVKVPYGERQVFRAIIRVREDLCHVCDYFRDYDGQRNRFGQSGVCEFGDATRESGKKSGVPICHLQYIKPRHLN